MARLTIQSTTPGTDRAIQRGVRKAVRIKVEETKHRICITFYLTEPKTKASAAQIDRCDRG